MKILEHRALRGGNRYSAYPTMFMLLDLGDLEDRPSDEIPGLPERLVALLPTLHAHRCSVGTPGGKRTDSFVDGAMGWGTNGALYGILGVLFVCLANA